MDFERNEGDDACLLGQRVVGGATEVSQIILERLSKSNEDLEFSNADDAIQYLIEVIVFYMHLADRVVFSKIGGAKRRQFMDKFVVAVLEELQRQRADQSPNFEHALRDTYNYRQTYYAQFTSLVPVQNGPLKGTLYWEFSKVLFELISDTNPATLMLLNIAVVHMTDIMLEKVIRDG